MKKLASVVLVLAASSAFAAGFRIDTHDGRATGLGGAVSGLVDNASANFYNPAALTRGGRGFEVEVGDTLIFPNVQFTGTDGTTTSTVFSVSPPPHLYARIGLLDELALGFGVFVPFGASGHWPEDWPGQFRARESSVTTYDFNINLAYAMHPRVSFAVGVNVIRGTLVIERHLDFVDSIGAVTLGGGAWGVGFNAALRVNIIENWLTFGAQLRSSTELALAGSAHFEGVPVELQGRIYDQPIKSTVTLPLVGQFGFGITPFKKFRAGIDVTLVGWSSMRELRIEFENPDLTVPLKKDWFDTASVHFGLEYDVTDSISARLGFVYDPTPSPANTLTPDLPDATRIKVCAGLGYRHSSGFYVDAGFQIIALLAQSSSAPGFPGTYGGNAGLLSISLGYKRAPSQAVAEEAPPAAEKPAEKPAEAPAPAPGEQPMTP